MSHLKHQKGLTLIEILIGLVLGILVTAGILQVFFAVGQSNQLQEANSRVQESGRFALSFMRPNLRASARLNFCVSNLEITNHLDPTGTGYVDSLFNPNLAIVGWNFSGTDGGSTYALPATLEAGGANANNWVGTAGDDLPAQIAALAVPGSDVVVAKSVEAIEGLTGCNNNVINSSALNINFSNTNTVCPDPAPISDEEMEQLLPQGSLVLVTDCSNGGDLFQRTNQSNASSLSRGSGAGGADPGNLPPNTDWSTTYSDTMQVYAVRAYGYFVGENPVGGTSLYRINIGNGGSNATAEELVEGIENMQIRFGEVDDATDTIVYVDPDDVTNPGNILSIAVSFLITSPGNADLETDDQTHAVNTVLINPEDDRNLRKVFDTTVAVRNRVVVL